MWSAIATGCLGRTRRCISTIPEHFMNTHNDSNRSRFQRKKWKYTKGIIPATKSTGTQADPTTDRNSRCIRNPHDTCNLSMRSWAHLIGRRLRAPPVAPIFHVGAPGNSLIATCPPHERSTWLADSSVHPLPILACTAGVQCWTTSLSSSEQEHSYRGGHLKMSMSKAFGGQGFQLVQWTTHCTRVTAL